MNGRHPVTRISVQVAVSQSLRGASDSAEILLTMAIILLYIRRRIGRSPQERIR